MTTRRQRVLVAGATGYLGGHVALEFASRGHIVRALARSPEKLDGIQLDDIVQAEITRPESLRGVCEGIDTVFSSVGITKQKDGLTFRDVDYRGELLAFFTAMATSDVVAPAAGSRTLKAHFEEIAQRQEMSR